MGSIYRSLRDSVLDPVSSSESCSERLSPRFRAVGPSTNDTHCLVLGPLLLRQMINTLLQSYFADTVTSLVVH